MKRILKMTAIALVIMLGSALRNSVSAQSDYYDDSRDVSYQTFYDELSPHGNWIEYPGHGYVWQPGMGADFRPYSTGGNWVWSDDYEWIWVSDYDWGWAPFHYGRWFSDPSYGWLWVPGYEWSGAWVTWRDGGDYYGWAPIRPGISININFNIGGYAPPIDYWSFAPRRHILSRNIFSHCIDYRRNVTIIHHTTIINNYNYGDSYGWRSGPRRHDVERYAGRINPVRFRASTRPGRSEFRNNEVSIYRPNVRSANNGGIAPRKFDRYNRTGNNDNRVVGNNDTRTGNNDNEFRRRENGNRGNNEIKPRSNEVPVRDRGNERRFDRREPQTNPANPTNPVNPAERRKFDRNDNRPNEQPNREPRVIRPNTQPTTTPGNNGGIENRGERRDNGNNPNRRQETGPQPRQIERRQAPTRVEQPRQEKPRQEQPRKFERSDNNGNGRQQGNGDAGNGKDKGKRRF